MSGLFDLPHDILHDKIQITKLPIKSLLRARCISKSWRAFIDSSAFINMHLYQSMENPKLALRYSNRLYTMDPKTSYTEMQIAMVRRGLCTWGSCNGVLCLTYDKGNDTAICLWNAATRQEKELPSFGIEQCNWCLRLNIAYGFGYSSTVNDYEVVKVMFHGTNCKCQSEVYVFSLDKNLWRRVQNIPYKIPTESQGELVNGAVHWVATRCDTGLNDYNLVIAFDIGGENFREVPQPDYKNNGEFDMSVAELGGKLCILRNYETRVEAWLMGDYGVRGSWRKLFNIRQRIQSLKPLLYTVNDGILLHKDGKSLVCYLPSFRKMYYVAQGTASFEATIYVESLVRLN